MVEDGHPVPAELFEAVRIVTREQIVDAIGTEGLERVSDVARATGATTGCGGCRTQVERLLAEHDRESLRDVRAARAG